MKLTTAIVDRCLPERGNPVQHRCPQTPQGEAGEVWLGEARLGATGRGEARQGKTRQARRNLDRRGETRQRGAWPVPARQAKHRSSIKQGER
jgi:hypothetical protein